MEEKEATPGGSVITLDSYIAELPRLQAFVDGFGEHEGVPEETVHQWQVALEELIVNVIQHGGCEPKDSAIRLEIKRNGDEISAVLSDRGVAFNPLDVPSPDLAKHLYDRPVGGLGILLVRHFITSIRYERRENRNYLFLTTLVKPESGAVSPEEENYADGHGNYQS